MQFYPYTAARLHAADLVQGSSQVILCLPLRFSHLLELSC